jgi:hypothetical protein
MKYFCHIAGSWEGIQILPKHFLMGYPDGLGLRRWAILCLLTQWPNKPKHIVGVERRTKKEGFQELLESSLELHSVGGYLREQLHVIECTWWRISVGGGCYFTIFKPMDVGQILALKGTFVEMCMNWCDGGFLSFKFPLLCLSRYLFLAVEPWIYTFSLLLC